jgi:uncharacterized glyoxalase superfamily protein PhnB
LCDRGFEGVQYADIHGLACQALQACVQFLWFLLGKLIHGADAKLLEIAEHRGPDRDEILQAAFLQMEPPFLSGFISLYFRHRLKQTLPHSRCSAQEVFMRTKWLFPAVLVALIILVVAGLRSIAAPRLLPQNPASPSTEKEKRPMVKKLTPVLFVKEIEPVLPFWVEGLGFTKTTEVPEGNKLGFVILEKDGVEVMYQTYTSADKDMPAIAGDVRKGPTFLYVQVDDLESVKAAVKRAEVYMPERKTFYGATEIGVKDPAGHFITFAQFAVAPQH